MQAMIFAAGLGTRLKPLTDHTPKALVSVGGRSLLERVVCVLKEAGADRIVVNVHHFAQQIVDYLNRNNHFSADIRVSDESDSLLDTGGGIKKAAGLFSPDAPVLIHNVDILSNVDLRKFYSLAIEQNADALLLVSQRKTKRYLLFNEEMRLVGWTNVETGEVKSPYAGLDVSRCQMYAFSGIHVFSSRLFSLMDVFPDKFSIIDFYLQVCHTAQISGYVKDDLQLMDVGKMETISEAEHFLASLQQQ